ncbi:MAG: tail fiber domain-containing protein, partial [Flavobacteriales bacterium]|nr:tail fiber domain-containing protein [Flavobacteriales bacterium]
SPWGTDRMKFVFCGGYNSSSHSGQSSIQGLEAMRLWPRDGDNVNVGIGDFSVPNTDPTERLDVLTGRVRIQQLPDNPEAPTLTKVLVVDDSPSPNGERGVVKWRYLPTTPASTCEWTLLGPPGSNSNIATAYTGNPGCPQMDKGVGIGVSIPNAKLEVLHTNFTSLSKAGIKSTIQSVDQQDYYAIRGEAVPANPNGFGSTSSGVSGYARNARNAIGLEGMAIVDDNTTSMAAFGLRAHGHLINGVANQGAYGVFGIASVTNTPNPAGLVAVFGHLQAPPGTPNAWAGYFTGDVNVQGGGYFLNGNFVVSDAQFKTNVEPLEDPLAIVMQLQAHRYDLLSEEFPEMNFPTGGQVGLIAQELEEVVPSLVRDTRSLPVLDSMGTEMAPGIAYKAVNYAGLVPYLLGAIQQQQATISAMQQQLNACCAATDPGMTPGDGNQKTTPAEELKEQRLLIIPNPVAELTTLEYHVPTAGRVSLVVSSIDGKPLGTLREEQAEAGMYSYTWNTANLAAGTYLCTYMLNGAVVVQRAVKVR